MTPPAPTTARKALRFLQGWAINTFAVAVAALLLRGISYQHGQDLLLASLLLGILNTFARPLLMFIALPLLILTLGFSKSGFAAAMAISVMMLPIIIRASDVVLRQIGRAHV